MIVQAASLANLKQPVSVRSLGGKRKAQMYRSNPILDVLELQRQLKAKASDPETTASALAQVARAYRDLQDLLGELRGVGKPKPVPAVNDPAVNLKRQPKPSQSFSETPSEPKKGQAG